MPTLQDLGFAKDEERALASNKNPTAAMNFVGGEDEALKRLQTWMFDDGKG